LATVVAIVIPLPACGPGITKPVDRLQTQSGLAVDVVVVSPDGHRLALATNPHNPVHGAPAPPSHVEIWDLASRQRRHQLPAHERTEALAFSPDGGRLYAGAYDKTIVVWELQTARELATLSDTDAVCCLSATPEGQLLSGGAQPAEKEDRDVRVWDLTARRIARRLLGEQAGVMSLALSKDGKTVVAGKNRLRVEVFDLASGRLTRALMCQGHDFNWVETVAISSDATLLATGNGSRLEVWDLPTGRSLKVFHPHRSSLGESERVRTLAFSPDGRFLASSGRDGTTKLWDTKTWRAVRAFAERSLLKMSLDVYTKTDAESMAFSPAGDLLYTGHDDGIVRVWEVPRARN
jgi:WD40 repeat protein